MDPKKRLLAAWGLFVFICFSVWITYKAKKMEKGASRGGSSSELLRKPAPDFSLRNLDGQEVTLSEFKGKKTVLIDFWASWCGPCRMEMPDLTSLYKKKGGRDFEILAVSIDQEPLNARHYAKETALPFPVLLDPSQKVAEAYQVNGIPSVFLVGRDGTIDYFQEGSGPGLEFMVESELRKEGEKEKADDSASHH